LGLAHYNLGLVLVKEKKIEQAIASFQRAKQLSPNAPEPSFHLGLAYLQQGKIEEAEKAFENAIELNPNYAEAQYNLGTILFDRGNNEAALDAFRKATAANPYYANAYYAAGLVFVRQKRYQQAKPVLQYAQQLYTDQKQKEWAAYAAKLLETIADK
jgi:tetratricopeptide (TPR) repeat protein